MSIRRFRDRLMRDESAAIAPLYAVGLFTLIGMAGVAFDYTRMMALDSELQNAADQAALAGATQLDGKIASGSDIGACARAVNAVRNFVQNNSRFEGDAANAQITFQNETGCTTTESQTGNIRFWQDREGTTPASGPENANFIEVFVDPRATRFSLTPLVDAFSSGPMRAGAMAGVGAAVCKMPPIMICHPDPGDEDNPNPFNADARRGAGIMATGHSTGANNGQGGNPGSDTDGATPTTHWSPGNFGFLEIQTDGTNNATKKALLQALAFPVPNIGCISPDGNKVSTGTPQGLYDAVNTRFGIYDFPNGGNGNALAGCEGSTNGANAAPSKCPPAPNVRMDLRQTGSGCGLNRSSGAGGSGFALPPDGEEFEPVNPGGAYSATTQYNINTAMSKMGFPRDLCHYDTFSAGALCPGGTGRIGTGQWAREDYWETNHPGDTKPTGYDTMSRYDVYLWEIANAKGENPYCGTGPGDADRRVLTIAVVSNCKELRGGSVDVEIDEFVDTFLVEPSIDDNGTGEKNRRHIAGFKDAIYLEIIGESKLAGTGVFGSQEVRRDVPYLVR